MFNADDYEGGEVLSMMAARFSFPSSYLVLDLETTGFSKTRDFIIDAGCAIVVDNKIVQHASLLVDWSKAPGIDCDYIRNQLSRQAQEYAKVGRPHYYSWERLCAEGRHPGDVLTTYVRMIYDHIVSGQSVIVGHGFYRFDRDVLDSHTQRFMSGYVLPWQHNSILDTGLIEKATQLGSGPQVGDTVDDWLDRIDRAYSKSKWNLGGHCVPKYNLIGRYGVDTRLLHTAGVDCVVTCHLLDTFRQLAEVYDGRRQAIFP